MVMLLRAEWRKAWRRPFEAYLALVAFAIGIVVPVAMTAFVGAPAGRDLLPYLTFPSDVGAVAHQFNRVAPFLGIVLGASALGGEYDGGTHEVLLVLHGDRTRLLAAKVAAAVGFCLVAAAVLLIAWTASAAFCSWSLAATTRHHGTPTTVMAEVLSLILYLTFSPLIGLAASGLSQSTAGGVALGLSLPLLDAIVSPSGVGLWVAPFRHITNVSFRLTKAEVSVAPLPVGLAVSGLVLIAYAVLWLGLSSRWSEPRTRV